MTSESLSQNFASRFLRFRVEYILMALVLIIWLAVNLLFALSKMDWITNSDSGWYWRSAQSLTPFDSAIPIGYPLIWRTLVELLPAIPFVFLGQAINLLAMIMTVVVIYHLMIALNIVNPAHATLIILLFPLVGITNLIQPRSNALLYLLIFSALLTYVRSHRLGFALTASMILLVHRSALPSLGLLIVIGLWERKITLWMLPIIFAPVIIYWLTGISQGQELTWYLSGYAENEKIIGLPLGDGLFGTLVSGLRGSVTDIIQAAILILYWILAIILLISPVWRSNLFLLALIVPVIILGLIQPAAEIWAMYNYTQYFAIPVLVYAQQKGIWPVRRSIFMFIVAGLILSQFMWAIYTLKFTTVL
jgi:hypothetical protein